MHSSTCSPPVEPAPFVEIAVFFPLDGFSSFVKDQVIIGVCVHFYVFSPIPLIYLSVCVPIPCSFAVVGGGGSGGGGGFLSLMLCSTA